MNDWSLDPSLVARPNAAWKISLKSLADLCVFDIFPRPFAARGGQLTISQSDQTQSAMNILEHQAKWERFKTLIKGAVIAMLVGVLPAIWVSQLWHY